MKQIEITTKVNMSLSEVDKILKNQGFKLIRTSRIEDTYMTQYNGKLDKSNIINVLKSSVLIRYLNVNNSEEFKKITYKNKVYNGSTVLSEEKINVEINDIEKAYKLFSVLNFKTLVEVKYDAIVYKKDDVELCFQNVENLGLLLEYENPNDFDGISNEEIHKEKIKMLEKIKKFNLNISEDFDIKKAYELIKKKCEV